MKLRKGKPRYKIPPHSQVLGVYVEGNQPHNQMASIQLQMIPLEALPDEKPGLPRYCSVLREIIEFSPPPDHPYKVIVRYVPPVMDF